MNSAKRNSSTESASASVLEFRFADCGPMRGRFGWQAASNAGESASRELPVGNNFLREIVSQ